MPYDVMVSMKDSKSLSLGSNPSEATKFFNVWIM